MKLELEEITDGRNRSSQPLKLSLVTVMCFLTLCKAGINRDNKLSLGPEELGSQIVFVCQPPWMCKSQAFTAGPSKLTFPLSLKYNTLILDTIGSILDELLNSRCCALDPETAVSESSLSYYFVFGLRQLTGNSGATVQLCVMKSINTV